MVVETAPTAAKSDYNWKSEYMREYTTDKLLKCKPIIPETAVKFSDSETQTITKIPVRTIPKNTAVQEVQTLPDTINTEDKTKVSFDAHPEEQIKPKVEKLDKIDVEDFIKPPQQKNHSQLDINKRPIMAQYGIGNVKPTIPENHMKTFNVRAPFKEVLND